MTISDHKIHRAAAVGMFDGVHLGHQMLVKQLCGLSEARGLSACIFTFSDHPMALVAPERAPAILTDVARRTDLLTVAGAREVMVLRFDEALRTLSAEQFMVRLRDRYGVRVLLVGFNHHFGRDRRGSFDDYRLLGLQLGIEVIRADECVVDGVTVSSSHVRKLLADGDICGAERLLGHPFMFSGRVVHGRQLGRTIDFPTANIKPYLEQQVLPKAGAYACVATVTGSGRFPAMVNIGTNPTVNSGPVTSIEANLIGYDGDLYGSVVEITFVDRLRDERKFPGLSALADQLAYDREQTLRRVSGH